MSDEAVGLLREWATDRITCEFQVKNWRRSEGQVTPYPVGWNAPCGTCHGCRVVAFLDRIDSSAPDDSEPEQPPDNARGDGPAKDQGE